MMSVKCSHECLQSKRWPCMLCKCVFDGNTAAVMMLLTLSCTNDLGPPGGAWLNGSIAALWKKNVNFYFCYEVKLFFGTVDTLNVKCFICLICFEWHFYFFIIIMDFMECELMTISIFFFFFKQFVYFICWWKVLNYSWPGTKIKDYKYLSPHKSAPKCTPDGTARFYYFVPNLKYE